MAARTYFFLTRKYDDRGPATASPLVVQCNKVTRIYLYPIDTSPEELDFE